MFDKKTAGVTGTAIGGGLGIASVGALSQKVGLKGFGAVVPLAIGAIVGSHLGSKLEDHLKEKKAMDSAVMQAFSDELVKIKQAEMEADGGFLGDVASKIKNVAMTDVGGPKGILQPAGQALAGAAAKSTNASRGSFQNFSKKYEASQAAAGR